MEIAVQGVYAALDMLGDVLRGKRQAEIVTDEGQGVLKADGLWSGHGLLLLPVPEATQEDGLGKGVCLLPSVRKPEGEKVIKPFSDERVVAQVDEGEIADLRAFRQGKFHEERVDIAALIMRQVRRNQKDQASRAVSRVEAIAEARGALSVGDVDKFRVGVRVGGNISVAFEVPYGFQAERNKVVLWFCAIIHCDYAVTFG